MTVPRPPAPSGTGPIVVVDDSPIDLEVLAWAHRQSRLDNELLTFGDGPFVPGPPGGDAGR